MKIKLFFDANYNAPSILGVQGEVNEFISGKEVVDIKFTSEGAENGHSYMIMVIYKEEIQ